MSDTKIKAFVAHIVEECEQEGFTVQEVLSIPQELRWAINDCVIRLHGEVNLNGLRVEQETSGKDAGIH